MLFLIDYDSRTAEIVELREFNDTENLRAQYEKLQRELTVAKRGLLLREVALIEATDLLALKRNHWRYFQSATERSNNIFPEISDPKFD